MAMRNLIAEKIKSIRKKRRLTQLAVARLVGTSNSYLAHVERYDVIPSLDFAFKFELQLGLKNGELSKLIINEKMKKARQELQLIRTNGRNHLSYSV